MTENNMTEAEIMKALRCCADRYCKGCDERGKPNCRESIASLAWNLIPDKKAENECLIKENIDLRESLAKATMPSGCCVTYHEEQIRAEAVKEFSERVKDEFKDSWFFGRDVANSHIDQIAKEMGVE